MRNPNDSALQAQINELRQLLRANPLRSASVEKGRTRYYGGSQLLIEDSNLSVTGTAEVFGILRVVGTAIVEGLGRLVVNSLIDLLGSMRVRGGGSITVEDGGDVVVDGGMIKAGNVEIRDGKIYVADMVIDPEDNGGSVIFGDGAKVTANDGAAGVKIESGAGWAAYIAANGIRLAGDVGQASVTLLPDSLAIGADRVQVSADDLVLGAPNADLIDVSHVLARTSTGEARWIPKAQMVT